VPFASVICIAHDESPRMTIWGAMERAAKLAAGLAELARQKIAGMHSLQKTGEEKPKNCRYALGFRQSIAGMNSYLQYFGESPLWNAHIGRFDPFTQCIPAIFWR